MPNDGSSSPRIRDEASIDLERLLKLRLVVARYGEMDLARWWNTEGILGRHGVLALRRGFPVTHRFAQARVAFAVAGARCAELVGATDALTLWRLSPAIEQGFEDAWGGWCAEADTWQALFEHLAEMHAPSGDARELLTHLDDAVRLDEGVAAELDRLRVDDASRSVALPIDREPDDGVLTLLAAAFALGRSGTPVVPYVRTGS